MAECGDSKNQKTKADSKSLSQEQIVAGFQELRNQQRMTINKIAEVDLDKKEHELVIDALKKVDPSRKCFRMIGGVLVERTVQEILPVVIYNCEQMSKISETLRKQLEAKGKELQEYREKHNIKIRGESDKPFEEEDKSTKNLTPSILVAGEHSS
ncbi:hypothetical protein HELRODRAFT_84863 [Helobdella robusta]|uniref:Prefoldin subunit 2 n=1 Tax=Helobdella robusta TaxID=6412 RepID=T1G5P8_HELRO|nr:hypothetical protein HELRODRAFT_84863 [Helobdella robusta]ESN98079.1 hypothetical protein HELRODRAFT_84863 [Helobdella robusta]